MMEMRPIQSAEAAVDYFNKALSKEDGLVKEEYYSKEQAGRFGGKGAELLGLRDQEVTAKQFKNLMFNRHPVTGEKLTPRDKANRIPGYEIVFNMPKSVSILYALSQDKQLKDAFDHSIKLTLEQMESEMKVQVSEAGGGKSRRVAGNMIWMEYDHSTTRGVDGIPCPQPHRHVIVPNAIWDSVENRYKAGYFGDLKRDASYFQASFHLRLANELQKLGLEVERTPHAFEIKGISRDVIDKFSLRQKQIQDAARQKGITDPKQVAQLALHIREKKNPLMTLKQLIPVWWNRLSGSEKKQLQEFRFGKSKIQGQAKDAEQAISHALNHHLERQSVVAERKVLAEGMHQAIGKGLAPAEIEAALSRREDVITGEERGQRKLTTKEVLAEEQELFAKVRAGLGSTFSLGGGQTENFRDEYLSSQQQAAVKHILGSKDKVIAVRGAAGVGKSVMMARAVEAIRMQGREVFAFAPTTGARDVLKEKGLKAETVARLLVDKQLQGQLPGQVIWVDEAGLLSTKDMHSLVKIAEQCNARLILQGDYQQHSSVSRGDAFRDLERYAGLKMAQITEVRRQQGEYKAAVEMLARGDTEAGFDKLDSLGAIKEVENRTEREQQIAESYFKSTRAGKTVRVVSPTHREGERINSFIRGRLQEEGLISKNEQSFLRLQNTQWTESQKQDILLYEKGMIVQFNQNCSGITKGHRTRVLGVVNGQVMVTNSSGVPTTLPRNRANHFEVYHEKEIKLAVGDQIRFTQGGNAGLNQKVRVANGAEYKVKGFVPQGVVLNNGWIIDKHWKHFRHAYVSTSHAAQGWDGAKVIVAQSGDSLGASNKNQFYVSASRAKQEIEIFTDNKQNLKEAIARSGERMSAVELAKHQAQQSKQFRMHRWHDWFHRKQEEKRRSNTAQRKKQTIPVFVQRTIKMSAPTKRAEAPRERVQ